MNTNELANLMMDYGQLVSAGETDAASKVEANLREKLKTEFSQDYVDTLFVRANSYATATNPTEKIAALDGLGFMIRSPGEWANPPENKGTWGSFGEGFMHGLTAPFQRRFDEPRAAVSEQSFMDRQIHHPTAAAAGNFAGSIVPETVAAVALSKVKPLQGLVPLAEKYAPGAVKAAQSVVDKATAPVIGAVTGGTMGAIDPAQSATQGAIAGAAGATTAQTVRKAFSPKASVQPEPIQTLVEKQRAKGYWAAPGYQSGSKAKMQLDHAIKKNPLTADRVDERLQGNRQLLTQETARAMGIAEPPPTLSIETLNAQRMHLNTQLDGVYSRTVPIFSKRDRNTPAALSRVYTRKTGEEIPNEFSNFTDRYDALISSSATGTTARVGPQLRNLVHDLSDRAHYHMTNPSGNKELGVALRGMLNTVETATGRRLGPDALDSWKEVRTQQGLLLDLVENDPELLRTGLVSPRALVKTIESGKSRNLEYIQRRRDLWDSGRFILQQERAFENSLSSGQRFGHWLRSHQMEIPSFKQGLADLTKPVPYLGSIPVNKYLGGRYYRLPKDLAAEQRAGLAGGILAPNLLPEDKEYQFKTGILD
jgi:hypothetical protein